MTEPAVMKPERGLQPKFIIDKFFSSLVVALPIFAAAVWHNGQPSRTPGPDRLVSGRAIAISIGPGLRAWQLSAADPRFGGLSALVFDQGTLIALTDSGVVVRFPAPDAGQHLAVALHDLPDGPGRATRKSWRDSESLLADPAGRGWWVGFENRHSLWLFDRDFTRVVTKHLLDVDWPANGGAEALLAGAAGVMALPEGGGAVAGPDTGANGALIGPAWVSDATRLRDGRTVLLIRRPSFTGFDNQLWISAGVGKPVRKIALDLGMLDNMEGLAAASSPNGGIRLWIVSDNNFRPWMRTLLIALDLPPGA